MIKAVDIESLEAPYDLDVNVRNSFRYPKGGRQVSPQRAKGIKRRANMYKTFDGNIWRYEVSLFGEEFSFISHAGLTGANLYGICEEMYIERSFE